MTKRIIGPPPGWAHDGYGCAWASTGFRGWYIAETEVVWLDWHPEVTSALTQAEQCYHAHHHR